MSVQARKIHNWSMLLTFYGQNSIYSDNSRNTGRFSAYSAAVSMGCPSKVVELSTLKYPHLIPTQTPLPEVCPKRFNEWSR